MIIRCTRLLFCMLLFGCFVQSSFAQCGLINGNLTVTNTNDDGPGSLRWAINCANELEGSNRIIFQIPSNGQNRKNIFVGSTTGEPLPSLIDEGTIIDGSFQPGATDRPRIVLDGGRVEWDAPINGLFIVADNCEIYGLEIRNFPDDGIDVFGANNVKIGALAKGNVIYKCGEERDFYEGVNPSGPWEGSGIALRNGSSFCEIKSNFIGTDARTTNNLSNEYCGILISGNSNGNLVGGSVFQEINVIAFNPTAIRVEGSTQNPLLGNSIVCNDTAAIVLANGGNNLKTAPSILIANNRDISGRGIPGDRIEIFLNISRACPEQACQGQLSVGTARVAADSTWNFFIAGTPSVGNIDFLEYDRAAATATDADGNTSNFSSCRIVNIDTENCADANGNIIVTNTDDDGPGSLRAAIECANSTAGANTIQFNIAGNGPHIINVGASTQQALPTLTDNNTIIDASTQNGFSGRPQIVLNGNTTTWNAPINALFINGNNCEVYGLEIRNFPDDGIDITAANNVIIGEAGKGNVIYNCGIEQDFWPNINPSGSWEGCGIVVKGGSSNCTISGNIIGTNYNQSLSVGNEFCGINIGGQVRNVLIGGEDTAAGNIITNNPTGVLIGTTATSIQLHQNSFVCNDTLAIGLRGNANAGKTPPVITDYTESIVAGTANAGDLIEVFISSTATCPDQACQGQTFLGSTRAGNNGNWELQLGASDSRLSLEVVTATATDASGNTSPFADCFTKAEVNCDNFSASIPQNQRQDVTCGKDNGAFVLSVTGGTAPYTYDIGNGPQLSPRFENLARGTYSVTIMDANGCEATQATAINESDPLSLIIVDQENAVCGQARGQFSVLAFGSVAPYTYDIGNGAGRNFTFTELPPGEYTVTVTDATGCTETEIIEIEDEEGLKLNLLEVQDASCGDKNGFVIATTADGIEPIVYALNGIRSSSPNFIDLAPGDYILSATDANGCTAERAFSIAATPELELAIANVRNADCDQRGGLIQVETSGGTPPISFNYGAGVINSTTFNNLLPGTYLITATDANGCTAIQSARVDASGDLEVSIENVIDASCNRENGAFTVNPNNGTAPYTYDIGNGASGSNIFRDLAEGTYTVTVSDARGCETTHDITIGMISPLELQIVNVRNANCSNNSGGSFSVLASGGTLPISYDIGNGTTSNPFFRNLAPGDYSITATDAIGCTFTQEVSIQQTGELEVQIAVEEATCGQSNGVVAVINSSGTAPYQYSIDGDNFSNQLNNLAAGDYEIVIIDANGCSVTRSISVADRITIEADLNNVQNATCGQSNGQFSVRAAGGQKPYSYNIGTGQTNDPNFYNLSGGFYEVSISDAAGCQIVESIFIEESAPLTASIVEVVDASCQAENGSFAVEVNTGTAPFTYDIGFGASESNTFSQLPTGSYFVTIIDAAGCETTEIANISSATTDLFSTIQNIEDATCGLDNGTFEVVVNSGTPPYRYDIGNGQQNRSTFENLAPDAYTVTVTDASGCTSEHSLTIIQASEAINASVSQIEIAQCGQSNGSFQIEGRGGLAPYRYDIGLGTSMNGNFNNLSGGVYEVTVTDNANCSTTRSITIEESAPLTANIINVQEESCAQSNGSFEVAVISGTPPFAYNIGNGFTDNPNFTGLTTGSYSITVRDVNGCESTENVNITESDTGLNSTIANIEDATCGENNGAFEVVVNNGTAPFTYDIGNGQVNEANFENLAPDAYTVTVTDAAGCTSEHSLTIIRASEAISANISQIEIAQCGQSNGSFRIEGSGGLAPYRYDIGLGMTLNADFTNLSGGVYEVTVTDNANCSVVQSITIEESAPLTASIINVSEATCGQENGSFEVNIESGTAPFSYNIGNGFVENAIFENLAAGNYEISIQDVNGCQSVENITVGALGSDLVATAQQRNATCGENNGAFRINVQNGQAPYTFSFNGENFDLGEFEGIAVGTYTVFVFDALGCSTEVRVDIENEGTLMETNINNLETAQCGQSNGQFEVEVTGGTAPYTYDIGFGASESPNFTQVSGGVYELTITDASGCILVESISIEESAPLTFNLINIQDVTCGASNGGFEVEIETGTPPYAYDIGSGFVETPIFENLEVGTYTLRVRDVNGCENSEVVNVAAFTEELDARIVGRQDANCGEDNGAFSVQVNNGNAPYTFDIGNGASSDSSFTNLAFGAYELTVSDANGCSTILSVNVEQGADSVTGEVIQNISATCGRSNGSLTVQATSGVAPFTYDIGLGESTTPLFMDLSQGIYDITITDANGCKGSIEAILEESNPVTAEVSNLQNATCGADNGQFQVVVNSGTAPFTYDLGEGETSNPLFTDLAGGTYTLTITDANLCATSLRVNIDQNPPLRAEIIDLIATSCGEDNGAFSLNPRGGVAPYQFNLGEGLTDSSRFENLAAGTYEVRIIDSEGCESVESVEIPTSAPLEARLIGPTTATCGENNATLGVVVENGIAPIRYDIGQGTTSDPDFSDLAAGNYKVTITDARNCVAVLQAVVEASSGINFSIRKEDDFCGNGEGIVTVVPSGGTAPYSYDIGEGASENNRFEGLFPGEYEITVTDATGCESIATTTVRATSDLNVALLSQRRPTCGESNGRIVVSAGSGVAPYTFNIGNGAVSSPTFDNLAPGQYEVTIVDDVACEATVMIDLPSESEPPVAQIVEVEAVSCAGNDGGFRVEVSGGATPYTYTIGGSATTNSIFENLRAGNYTVTITDINGCSTMEAVEIEGTENLIASIENIENENCDAQNGAFEVITSGGTAPYRYNIGNGFTNNSTITGLASGNYTLTVVDARDCQTTQNISIESINDLRASVSNKAAASCTEENGAFTVLPTGGTAPYRYNIGEGFTASPRFEGLATGSYDITVTDANDCNFYLRTNVEGTSAPTLSISEREDASCGKDDGKVTLLASGGQSPYTYDIGGGASTSNRFDELADGTYEATVTDANGCSSELTFTIAMIGSLPSASFVVDTSELEVQLRNTSSNFDSLSWELGDGTTAAGSAVTYEYADEGTYTICLTTINACGSDTQCQEISLRSSVKKADLEGKVLTELDMPIEDVNLYTSNTDSTWTDADGLYALRLFRDSSYTITPSKDIDLLNGISTFDIFLINNHILGKELLDSPYKIIAADVNNSKTVTTFDVVMLRKLLLGISDALPNGNTSWRFVDADYIFPNPSNPFEEEFPENVRVDLENSMNNVNFIGIKIGDVNHSIDGNDDGDGDGINGIEERQNNTKYLEAQWSADQSEIIVYAPAEIFGLQFTLEFDPAQLKVAELTPAPLADLNLQNFALQHFDAGKIALSWNGEQATASRQELFRLRVNNFEKIDLEKVLKITSNLVAKEAFDLQQLYDLDLKINEHSNLELHGNAPNPFEDWTNIHFQLPQASEVVLSLYDSNGSLVRQEKHQLAAGDQNILVERQNLPAGVLYYRLEDGKNVVSGKMILVER